MIRYEISIKDNETDILNLLENAGECHRKSKLIMALLRSISRQYGTELTAKDYDYICEKIGYEGIFYTRTPGKENEGSSSQLNFQRENKENRLYSPRVNSHRNKNKRTASQKKTISHPKISSQKIKDDDIEIDENDIKSEVEYKNESTVNEMIEDKPSPIPAFIPKHPVTPKPIEVSQTDDEVSSKSSQEDDEVSPESSQEDNKISPEEDDAWAKIFQGEKAMDEKLSKEQGYQPENL